MGKGKVGMPEMMDRRYVINNIIKNRGMGGGRESGKGMCQKRWIGGGRESGKGM